jgi:outer membrane protein assembly factor BamB
MRDEPLTENVASVLEMIKQLLAEGRLQEVDYYYLYILRETSSRIVVDSFLSFCRQNSSLGKGLQVLVENGIFHLQNADFERLLLKLKIVLEYIAKSLGTALENLPAYHLLNSAGQVLQDPQQFSNYLQEALKETDFQNNLALVAQASNLLIQALQGIDISHISYIQTVLPEKTTPPQPPQRHSFLEEDPPQRDQELGFLSDSQEPPPSPRWEEQSQNTAPSTRADLPKRFNPLDLDEPPPYPPQPPTRAPIASFDEPLGTAPAYPPPTRAPIASFDEPLGTAPPYPPPTRTPIASFDEPLGTAPAYPPPTRVPIASFDEPLSAPPKQTPPARVPIASFDEPLPSSNVPPPRAPIPSVEGQGNSAQVSGTPSGNVIEKLERDVSAYIASNQLNEAIAFCREIVKLDPRRQDIQKKIQLLTGQVQQQKSKNSVKSFIRFLMFAFFLVLLLIAGWNYLGWMHLRKTQQEFTALFSAQNAPNSIAETKKALEKEEEIIVFYKKMEDLEKNNVFEKLPELEQATTQMKYTYHVIYELIPQVEEVKGWAHHYGLIFEEIKNLYKIKSEQYFLNARDQGEACRKTTTYKGFTEAAAIFEKALEAAKVLKSEADIQFFGKELQKCQETIKITEKRLAEQQEEKKKLEKEALSLLASMEKAIAEKDFESAYRHCKSIISRTDLLVLEVCKDLKLPLRIQSSPPRVEVLLNNKSLGEVDHLLIPYHHTQTVLLEFRQKGFISAQTNLFKNDLLQSSAIEVNLVRDTVWKFDAEAPIEAPMQMVEDLLYLATHNAKFIALDLKTGKESWAVKVTEASLASITKPFLLSKNKVYLVSTDKRVSCFDLKTQGAVWSDPPQFKKTITTGPCLINENILCVGVGDQLVFIATKNGKILAQWKAEGSVESTPSFSEEGLLCFGDNQRNYYALRLEKMSAQDFSAKAKMNLSPKLSLKANLTTKPVLSRKLHYLCLENRELLCLEEKNGELRPKWTYEAPEKMVSPPLLDGNALYVNCANNHLYAFNTTGETLWQFPTKFTIYYPPALSEDFLYLGGKSQILYCLTKKDGDATWFQEFSEELENTPIPYKKYLIVCDKKGKIYSISRE